MVGFVLLLHPRSIPHNLTTPTEGESVVKAKSKESQKQAGVPIQIPDKINAINKYDTTSQMYLTDISRTSPLKY